MATSNLIRRWSIRFSSVLLFGTMVLIAAWARAAGPAHLGDESESKATLLGIDAKGSKIVYVFDHSGSMGVPENKPLDRAKAELLASIDALSDVQQFYIIFYNQEQRVFRIDPTGGRLIFGTDHNKKLARQFVDSIHAEGATKHADALAMALGLRPDVIFLLTDGDPPDDITKDELARLDRLNGSGTVINVIQISPPLGEGQSNLLETLAKRTGGQHVYVDFTKPAEK
jgi:Mg-chelatase subunit ChlD